MKKRVLSVGLLLLALTACGGGSGGSSDPTTTAAKGSGTATTAATTAGADKTTDSSGGGKGDDKNPVDGTAFCAFLATMAPRLKSDGSAPGAKADFAIELANWIGEHPDQKPRTAADLDAASQKTCPKSRATAVAAMGATSFEDALG